MSVATLYQIAKWPPQNPEGLNPNDVSGVDVIMPVFGARAPGRSFVQRFIVDGISRDGQSLRREVHAASLGDVERLLSAEGFQIRAVSTDSGSPLSSPASPSAAAPAGPEQDIWRGGPSQWLNIGWFVSCILVLPIPWALWKYLELRATAFRLTSQRIKLESGVLSKRFDQIELYRVKDTVLTRSIVQRALGLGTIRMITSDPSQPEVVFPSIEDSERVQELVRQNVERMRRLRGVRELDVADDQSLSLHAS